MRKLQCVYCQTQCHNMFTTMDSRVYNSKLINHKLFKVLKESLPESAGELQNILECYDDLLFVWNSLENCVLTLNLSNLEYEDEDVPFQTLLATNPPCFDVHRLSCSSGSRLVLWGPHGVAVLELPQRWGSKGFQGGKDTVLCKSYILDERLFLTSTEVRRVRWHPDSSTHLLVLTSDNSIRFYNVASNTNRLVRVISVGQNPAATLAGIKLLDSLGDTAVDFDFAPAIPSDTPPLLTRSLVVLRGNGMVYMIDCSLRDDGPLSRKLHGPLTMYPPAEDNYGVDSCKIMVVGFGGNPPAVVIATSSAILYHCLLLPDTLEKDDFDKNRNNADQDDSGYSLYVLEAVELTTDLNPESVSSSCLGPLDLYPEVGSKENYACIHSAGVHMVSMPLMAQLRKYFDSDENNSDGSVEDSLSGVVGGASVAQARYVLCTRGPGQTGSKSPRGLAVLGTTTAAVLLAEGTLVTRPLEPYHLTSLLFDESKLPKNEFEDQNENSFKELQKVSFLIHIQKLLNRQVSQPLLQISHTEEPSLQECAEIVTRTIAKLRSEYLSRLSRAASSISGRVRALQRLLEHHAQRSQHAQQHSQHALQRSQLLQDKCQSVRDKQDNINHRCSAVIRFARGRSSLVLCERDFLKQLQQQSRQLQDTRQQFEKLQLKADYQKLEVQKWEEEYKMFPESCLGQSHSDSIAFILKQQTGQIKELIEEIKILKEQLGIV